MDPRRAPPRRVLRARICALTAFGALVSGCGGAATSGGAAREVHLTSASAAARAHGKVSQAELQEDLQRFSGQFTDRLTQGMYEAIGDTPADSTSNYAMRLGLVYEASALDIATEALPELGVLDMAVFLRLNRATLAEYWVPKVLGERGQPLLKAFEDSEKTFWPIVDKILRPEQKAKLIAGIDAWRRENPDQVRVEAVRFLDFSTQAGAVASTRAKDASGMLASVQAATVAADQAVLLGERGLFLATRMPFLLRLQARLGAREILGDAERSVGELDALATSLQGLGPIMRELPALVASSTEEVRESRQLVEELRPLLPTAEDMSRLQRALDTSNKLVSNSVTLLSEMRATTTQGGQGPIERISKRVDSTLTRGLWYIIAIGAAWSALWWAGYVLAKRLAAPRPPRPPSPSHPATGLHGRDLPAPSA
jgi:hypothetical protein